MRMKIGFSTEETTKKVPAAELPAAESMAADPDEAYARGSGAGETFLLEEFPKKWIVGLSSAAGHIMRKTV